MAFTPVQKLSITSGAAMVLLAAVGLVAYLSITQLVDAQDAAAVTNTNIGRLDRVLARTAAAGEAIHRYAESGSPDALALIDSAQSDVEYALDSLLASSEDHPVQRRNLDSLGPLLGTRFRDYRQAILVRARIGHDTALALLSAGRPGPAAAQLIAQMRDEEVKVLGERARTMAESAKTTRVIIVAGSIFAFILALVALQPLRPSVERGLSARLTKAVPVVTDAESRRE